MTRGSSGRYGLLGIVAAGFMSLLLACGGGGGGDDSTAAAVITLTVSPSSAVADGASSVAITAVVSDRSGTPVPQDTSVTFSTTLGTFPNGGTRLTLATPDDTGTVVVSLIAGTVAGTAEITCTANGVTQRVTVEFITQGAARVVLAATPERIPADGVSTALVTAQILNGVGDPVPAGTPVTFTTTLGLFSNGDTTLMLSTPDGSGVVSTWLTSAKLGGTAVVTVTSGTVSQAIGVEFTATASLTLSADPASVAADGVSSMLITAQLLLASGEAVPQGTSAVFSTTLGSFPGGGTTANVTTLDDSGTVRISLRSATTAGFAQVTCTSHGVTQAITVAFVLQETATITLAASPTAIAADGASSATLTATLLTAAGQPVRQGTAVTFTTTLGTFPNGSTTFNVATPDASGRVSVSLVAGTAPGAAQVTCAANGVSQTVTVTFIDRRTATITLQAVPATISANGVSTSEITATLLDSRGEPVPPGTQATFTTDLGTFPGRATSISATTADATGTVTVTLQAGTTIGTATVRCESNGVEQSIEVQIAPAVQGGPAYGEHMGLAAKVLNIAGLKYTGLEDEITMRVSDRNFNEIPDGTPVSFTTDFGLIKSGEEEVPTTDSAAVSTLISTVPFPPDGFVTPASTALGGADARVLCMAIDPTNSSIIYVGTDGGGVFKSDDGGVNWFEKGVPGRGMTNGMVWDLQVDPANPAIVYAATDDGLFRSTGSGDDWEKVSRNKHVTGESLGPLTLTDLDQDGYSDQIYTLRYDSTGVRARTQVYLNGVETLQYRFFSSNSLRFIIRNLAGRAGEAISIDYHTATVFPALYPVRAVALGPLAPGGDPVTERVLYAGTLGRGVFKSEDGGFSWQAKNLGLSDQDVLSLAVDPVNAATLYAGTLGGGVFRSTDAGESWTPINNGLPASVVYDIRIDPGAPARIYLATDENGVYYSVDGGNSWLAPLTNVTSPRVTQIVLDSSIAPAQEIYAATEGDGVDPLGGVYRSADGGQTWARLTPLPENHALALGIVPGNPDRLYAGAWGRSVFVSADGGATWAPGNGTAPDDLTNQIFATTRMLFSADTIITAVQAETGGQGAGGLEYDNDTGSRGVIYHGTGANFLYTVQDQNGNPLIGGTQIQVTADSGTLFGETEETLPDTTANRNYSVFWQNDIDGDENVAGSLTIDVTSEGTADLPGNGNLAVTITRTLIRAVAFDMAPATPEPGGVLTVTPRGGSETVDTSNTPGARGGYTIFHRRPDGSTETVAVSYGQSAALNVGFIQGEGLVRVTDDITGESVEATYQFDEPEPQIVAFTASPASIEPGGRSTLSWTVTGAASASIDQGLGTISLPTGSVIVAPFSTTEYTLTALNNSGETVTMSVTVTVAEPEPTPTPTPQPPVIEAFVANPTSIPSGESSNLSWSITGATSATIDPPGVSVSPTNGTLVVNPTETTTYILTATNADGSDTAQTTVTVLP